mmetsp:Transcript_6973/g.11124  ORF Transcript_6973/g.11124 Transcript_6973/m.11124 type:complete len:551 (-) Transcript_6973:226-1878(-)
MKSMLSVEDMIKRSFSEFATQRALIKEDLPGTLKRYEKALKKARELSRKEPCIKEGESAIEDFYMMTQSSIEDTAALVDDTNQLLGGISRGARGGPLAPGRVVTVVSGGLVDAPAMVVGPDGGAAALPAGPGADGAIVALVLCPDGFEPPEVKAPVGSCSGGIGLGGSGWGGGGGPMGAGSDDEFFKGFKVMKKKDDDDNEGGLLGRRKKIMDKPFAVGTTAAVAGGRRLWLVRLLSPAITGVSGISKRIDPSAILDRSESAALNAVAKTLAEFDGAAAAPMPPLDYARELRVNDVGVLRRAQDLAVIQEVKAQSKCVGCPKLQDQYTAAHRQHRLAARAAELRRRLSDESLSLFPDFQQRLAVLRALGYVDGDGTVALKGRVACELNTADELVATELVFENLLEPLGPAEAAGVLSALVFQEKNADEPSLTPQLKESCDKLKSIANGLAKLQVANGLRLDVEEWLRCINFGIVDVVYDWARGVPFADICALTTVQEGSIVRAINRLNELVREVRNAARVIGDPTLYRKMEAVSEAIKRDIVFAASLYVT